MPMKNPPHPGEFIRTEIIEPAGLTVTAAAAVLQVSRPALSSLLNAKYSSPEESDHPRGRRPQTSGLWPQEKIPDPCPTPEVRRPMPGH